LAARINLIVSTGGFPVITLCAAPDWMKQGIGPAVAPLPVHYQDFAMLASKVARSFPSVRYFVVWNELKGFWNARAHNWAIQRYTQMYNDVYEAIKRVRPDAQVGGPYAATPPYPAARPGSAPSTPHGAWGYLDPRVLGAVTYWLRHKVGADFIAVDGPDFPKSGPITGPLTATEKFAAVDRWLRQSTALPIWWMESPVQPAGSGWSSQRAAAVRIAALLQLAASKARAGLQWQPQEGEGIPDEGLWTAVTSSRGGQPTPLVHLLPRVLAVLRDPVEIVRDQHPGVIVVTGRGGTIAVNTGAATAAAVAGGISVALGPGQVKVYMATGQAYRG
jgi:hypothetical protein